MPLLPTKETRAVCEATGQPFYWRGWSDRERTLDGKLIQLRSSHGPPITFRGSPVATICGRIVADFKVLPRYVDLFLYREDEHVSWPADRQWVCQRAWRSEAHGELPCVYHVMRERNLFHLSNTLFAFDPIEYADTLWTADTPAGKKRRGKAVSWMRKAYRHRVALLLKRAGEYENGRDVGREAGAGDQRGHGSAEGGESEG